MNTKVDALRRRLEALEQKRPAIRLLWASDVTPETVLEPGDIVLTFGDGSS